MRIASFLIGYVWVLFLPATIPAGQESFYYSLHMLWIPLSGTVLVAVPAALMLNGFLLVWDERAVDLGRQAVLGLAALAFAASCGAAVVRTFVGLTLGLVYAPELRGGLIVADLGLAIGLGLTLYWLLLGVGIQQARVAGIVALVTGSVSSVLAAWERATHPASSSIIGLTAGLLSLTLWLALFLWGYEELRLRGVSRPSGLPA